MNGLIRKRDKGKTDCFHRYLFAIFLFIAQSISFSKGAENAPLVYKSKIKNIPIKQVIVWSDDENEIKNPVVKFYGQKTNCDDYKTKPLVMAELNNKYKQEGKTYFSSDGWDNNALEGYFPVSIRGEMKVKSFKAKTLHAYVKFKSQKCYVKALVENKCPKNGIYNSDFKNCTVDCNITLEGSFQTHICVNLW